MISPLTTLKKSLINIQTGVLNFPDCDMNEIVSFTGDRVDEVVKRLGPGAIVSHDRFEQDGCSESIK